MAFHFHSRKILDIAVACNILKLRNRQTSASLKLFRLRDISASDEKQKKFEMSHKHRETSRYAGSHTGDMDF